MRVLITGVCGFVGSALASAFLDLPEPPEIYGIDNFVRPGSERNRSLLRALGVRVSHGDVRCASDFETIPDVDWVIDAAANPSVLAGVDGKSSSRQVIEHNLLGTVNLLEYCKRTDAGFILLSTSRVYSVQHLAALPVQVIDRAYRPDAYAPNIPGLSAAGVNESFSTTPPVSLYGATKVASEFLALEYAEAFGLPVWINRCGVLAGAGQFGRADQGIFAFWINSYLRRRPLSYIGFDGHGYQTRDCLHPSDLATILIKQMNEENAGAERVQNVSGGARSAMSLAQLSDWCSKRFGEHLVTGDPEPRSFDVPWIVLDHQRATRQWDWAPKVTTEQILEEIALHAEDNPHWLELSASV
jgi:CDP-paratose 2-epimerase